MKNQIIDKIIGSNEPKVKVGSTQEHLPIQDIRDDVVMLKDGSLAMVVKTTAVNFDLLSENEQLAIISSFAGMLNSLSFPIQIVIRSKRLDISNYIKNVTEKETAQTNPLLKNLIKQYRIFIETLTLENEVLDKQFYVVIAVSAIELGIVNNSTKNFQKGVTILIPRRDHIVKQLARLGLKASLLSTEELVKLYFDFYNDVHIQQEIKAFVDREILQREKDAKTSAETPAPVPTPTETQTTETQVTSGTINNFNQNPTTERENMKSEWLQKALKDEEDKRNTTAEEQATTANTVANTPPAPAHKIPDFLQPAQTETSQNTHQPGTEPTASQPTNNSPFVVEELGDNNAR